MLVQEEKAEEHETAVESKRGQEQGDAMGLGLDDIDKLMDAAYLPMEVDMTIDHLDSDSGAPTSLAYPSVLTLENMTNELLQGLLAKSVRAKKEN